MSRANSESAYRCWSLRTTALVGFVTMTTMTSLLSADTVRYRLTVHNTWSEETHPGLFPPNAHFSWHGGGTHNDEVSFWQVGELASPGMVLMAETGLTTTLVQEVQAAIDTGEAASTLEWPWWFCPDDIDHPACGELVVVFDVSDEHPLVTIVSMLGPSPDWFIGVSGLALQRGEEWLDEVVVDLHPYDGGTRDANVFQLFGPLTTPPEPISLITERSGQIITPASLGTYTFTRIDAECAADLDGSCVVDGADLGLLLGNWDNAGNGDLDDDGIVDGTDIGLLLAAWGPCE